MSVNTDQEQREKLTEIDPSDAKYPDDLKWSSDEDSDYSLEYINKLKGSDREMALKVKHPKPNYVPWGLKLLMPVVVLPVILHTILFAAEADNLPHVILRIAYVVFSIALAWSLFHFIHWTNEDSISGMVAQRHFRVSYITILFILNLSSFTSGLFIVFAVRSWARDHNYQDAAKYLLGFFSPLLSALILVVPLVVKKTKVDLGFMPMKKKQDKFYRLRLYKINTTWNDRLHGLVVGLGVLTGYIAIVINLYHKRNDYSYHYGFTIYYLVFSVINCITFACWPSKDSEKPSTARIGKETEVWKLQLRLFIEFIGLYYYLSALVLILTMNRDLLE